MCYFGTNNPFLVYAPCVILPTGQWGTPHYSQPATEEWMHLTALWGTWNTLYIENHLGLARCVIFNHIIQSRCLSYRGDSQTASEQRPLLATEERRLYGAIGHIKHWRPCVWDLMCYFGTNNLSWHMHHMWYYQPVSEDHPITPNRPLRNGCIWQQYGARETHQTLKIILGGIGVLYLTK